MKYLLLAPLLFLSACFAPKVIKQEQVLFDQLIKDNDRLSRHILRVGRDELFYAASGDVQKPSIIIIHGTPGSWEQYARYLLDEKLLEKFYVVVIDRPGWGKSRLSGDRQIASFNEQATVISTLAFKLKNGNRNQPVILMGHSLGASIAPKVAMNYPQSVDGLLLFAGTLSPDLSDPRWFNRAAKVSGVNFLVGDRMRRSNQEILALKNEMQAMRPLWANVNAETIVVQGMKDRLVYPENIFFAENSLNPDVTETIRLDQEGHLFPMTLRSDVVHWATCLLERIKSDKMHCGG